MFGVIIISNISNNSIITITTNITNNTIRSPSIYQQDGQPSSYQLYQV